MVTWLVYDGSHAVGALHYVECVQGTDALN